MRSWRVFCVGSEELAQELARKVGKSREAGTPPAEIGPVVEHALELRLPKVVPEQWSKYEELERVFDHVAKRFTEGAPQLRSRGFICTVNRSHDRLSVRVEPGGETVYGLNVTKGGPMGDDHITWLEGRGRFSDGSSNGWATPQYDKDRQVAVVTVSDMGRFGGSEADKGLSSEEFFQFFWNSLIDHLERL